MNENQQELFGVTKARIDAPNLDGNSDGNPAYSRDDLVVAVIDTGIDATHVDLAGKVLAFADFTVSPATERSPYDDQGHGTHVAATIAGSGVARDDRLEQGVAPGAALVGAKVLDGTGGGYDSWVIAGIDWVVANKAARGIEVVNLSLGSDGCSNGLDPVSQAVNRAVDAGLVVVVAAGNDGDSGSCTIGSPAAAAKAITVGAMADVTRAAGATELNLAYFSSRGPTADGRFKPDLTAPGVDVTSAAMGTGTGYVAHSGTSMATPFVAGTAALMLEANLSLTPALIKSALMQTAVDWGPPGLDYDTGAGRINAYAAINAAGGSLGSPSPMPGHQSFVGRLTGTGQIHDIPIGVTSPDTLVAATLVIAAWCFTCSADFDLYLYNPSGVLVSSSTFETRQEDVAYRAPNPGTYTARVVSYSGSGDYYAEATTLALTTPTVMAAPTILGTAEVGKTVTATLGSWAGSPAPSLRGAWNKCDLGGFGCNPISGAIGRTFVVPPPTVKPQNTNAAQISGIQAVGETLAVDPGTWRTPGESQLR